MNQKKNSPGKTIKTKKQVLPPLSAECSYPALFKASIFSIGDKINCLQTFKIKYNRTTGEHVWMNNWDYWTEKEKDKGKYICNNCLITFYKKHKYFFWESVPGEKKKRTLGTYVNGRLLVFRKKSKP